jgi:branched-subunit amino acid ABC-type transport system permease component
MDIGILITQWLLTSIVRGSLYALIAVGLTLVFRILKLANFSHGELFVFGAYIGIVFFNSFWIDNVILNAVFSYFLAFGATAALAVFFDFAAYKPLRNREATPLMLMIASLGISIIIRGVIQFTWGPSVKKYNKPPQEIVNIGGAAIYNSEIVVIIAVIAIFIGLYLLLTKTKSGTALRAISDSVDLAEVSGINTEQSIIFLWIIAGGFAGLSGAVFATISPAGIIPESGFQLLLFIFTAVILGSIGNIYGAIIGAFIITLIDTVAAGIFSLWSMSTEYSKIIVFVVLIIVLIFKPRGIFGGKT